MIQFDRYKDGKRYALTFSYDDGVEQDIHLLELLEQYQKVEYYMKNNFAYDDLYGG